jgi:hypothetical protein
VESEADLAHYFDPAHFGVTVQIGGADVNAIFDGGWAEALGVPGARPALTCRSSDIAGVARGTAVVVPGHGNFVFIEDRPDGSGISRVMLESA